MLIVVYFCSERANIEIEKLKPEQQISVLCAYAQMPLINAHPGVSNEPISLIVCLSLELLSCYVLANSEGAAKSAHISMLA